MGTDMQESLDANWRQHGSWLVLKPPGRPCFTLCKSKNLKLCTALSPKLCQNHVAFPSVVVCTEKPHK